MPVAFSRGRGKELKSEGAIIWDERQFKYKRVKLR